MGHLARVTSSNLVFEFKGVDELTLPNSGSVIGSATHSCASALMATTHEQRGRAQEAGTVRGKAGARQIQSARAHPKKGRRGGSADRARDWKALFRVWIRPSLPAVFCRYMYFQGILKYAF